MGHFLRDEQLSNISIGEEALNSLVDILAARQVTMPESLENPTATGPTAFLIFTIRFDEKGYRVFQKDQLISHFKSATRVERIVFELISGTALTTGRIRGSYIDLRLDTDGKTPCFLTVSSDDEDWVNSTFSVVRELIKKNKNRNAWIRNDWVELLIQVFGLLAGYFISLWGASLIAPQLTIENAFLISFVLVLLLFSNLWTPLRLKLLNVVVRIFPAIRFYRPDKDRTHWLNQALVGGIVVAGTLYVINWAFSYAGKLLARFMGIHS